MKKFIQKVIMPVIFAALLWFTVFEQDGFVNNLLNYVYGQDYYFVTAPEESDYTTETTGQYWFVTGEYNPVTNQSQESAFQPQNSSSREENEDELLFLIVEIKEEYGKDGQDAWAPEGYVKDDEIVMAPEGAMHPTIALYLYPIECTGFIVDGGPYCGFDHERTPGVDYDFIPKLLVTYKPNLTLTVFSNLR
ncbi:MAG: hypothetical protein GWN67_13080 [Phycisphaerae bacterium]|nr:hypothetical protein [Phycisphaerae bacterium]NIR67224.1 hypothetical protein [candidate division Zixibacteria bacterium]NIS52073.1 hypothetical protein [Phycisphaerae bacterium]NIU09612.1 hypothetical protein [Phycisphaerae bacterium]NIU57275.1 hypothetical protein [Phycisphaerae bacterium]